MSLPRSVTISHGAGVDRETLEATLARIGYPVAADGAVHHDDQAQGVAEDDRERTRSAEWMSTPRERPGGPSKEKRHSGSARLPASGSLMPTLRGIPRVPERPPSLSPKPAEGVRYTCPMHPEIVRDKPGSCPICGMALEPMTPTGDETNPELADMSRRFWVQPAAHGATADLAMGEMVLGGQISEPTPPWAVVSRGFSSPSRLPWFCGAGFRSSHAAGLRWSTAASTCSR